MSEKKWTPGPWRVLDGKYGLQIHSKKHWLSNIKCESCPAHEVANAHLIAAAPELYDALEELLRYEPQGVVECRGDKCREPWCASCYGWESAESHIEKIDSHFKSARAALAKARGEK